MPIAADMPAWAAAWKISYHKLNIGLTSRVRGFKLLGSLVLEREISSWLASNFTGSWIFCAELDGTVRNEPVRPPIAEIEFL